MAVIKINTKNRSKVIPTVRLVQPTQDQAEIVFKSCFLLKQKIENLIPYPFSINCSFAQQKLAEVLIVKYLVIFIPEKKERVKAEGNITFVSNMHPEFIYQLVLLQCKEVLVSYGIRTSRRNLLSKLSGLMI